MKSRSRFSGNHVVNQTATHHTSSTLRGAFFMGGSMIKRTFLALALFAGLLSPAYGAGTIGLSLTQRLDNISAKPLNGGKLYFIQAGTTSTPQNAFQDSALSIPWPNPITLDAGGNVPQLFFADGQIKIRLTNAAGVTQIVADNILVVGASSGGGGGGGTVDPTTIMATGDTKIRYGTGVLTGFVRQNGRTIGSASSGATERANADTQALFEYLWNNDPNLVVSTGRGASSNADWVANKTITLPDLRGRVIAGSDAMGSSTAGVLPSGPCANDTTLIGAQCGTAVRTLAQNQLPNVGLSTSSTGPISVTSNVGNIFLGNGINGIVNPGSGGIFAVSGVGSVLSGVTSTGTATIPGGTTSINGGVTQQQFYTVQPTIVMTIYMKL